MKTLQVRYVSLRDSWLDQRRSLTSLASRPTPSTCGKHDTPISRSRSSDSGQATSGTFGRYRPGPKPPDERADRSCPSAAPRRRKRSPHSAATTPTNKLGESTPRKLGAGLPQTQPWPARSDQPIALAGLARLDRSLVPSAHPSDKQLKSVNGCTTRYTEDDACDEKIICVLVQGFLVSPRDVWR